METTFSSLTPAQESLFLTLYLRALDCAARNPILGDTVSAEIAENIDYDFGRQQVSGSLVLDLACRTRTLDELVRSYLAQHPDAVVLDLGCGVDPRVLRCDPPAGVDWYDIDFPEVIAIRERFLPAASHTIPADLTAPDWMHAIPADRPTMIVADGLMAFLSGEEYRDLSRALTAHFAHGEFAFNAYTRLVLKLGNFSPTFKALGARSSGGGIDDPHEPESWGARLTLTEELLLVNSPDIAKYPQPLRAFTRLCAHNTWISRQGNRILRYRF
ncbi:class I SAM-dependent methyltransferase [Nocardia sp. NPDC046763]|uniref:class I SAM-dependent methyltransferase n=1 Tax=Nocardia sp. NPDC046763 TaxID=3155256 RepID=UPI0033DB1835